METIADILLDFLCGLLSKRCNHNASETIQALAHPGALLSVIDGMDANSGVSVDAFTDSVDARVSV